MRLRFLLLFTCACVATQASAAMAYITAVPTAWRLQNYVPASTVIWFAGTPCSNGMLTLPGTATVDDHSRLYATILSAKATGKAVFIFYDDASSSCQISSFGLL